VCNDYLKTGAGRNVPAMVSIVKNDPWWSADPHRKAYTDMTLLGPTVPEFFTYNPAYAQVRNEHVFGVAWADIVQHDMTPEAAADKALKRVTDIFAKYPIAQG
jgi:ABC-type glycerol-3-phosphate transport system substrate-binding protein